LLIRIILAHQDYSCSSGLFLLIRIILAHQDYSCSSGLFLLIRMILQLLYLSSFELHFVVFGGRRMTFNKFLLGFRRFLARGGLFLACVSFWCLSLVSLSHKKERKKERKNERKIDRTSFWCLFLVSFSLKKERKNELKKD